MNRVTFIGTSGAFGAAGRRQSAILVENDVGGVLLDCAPTTGTGLAALGISTERIDAVVISHFHADHFGGVPQLLLALRYEDERERPLLIAGPHQVEARVRAAAAALGHPIAEPLPFELRFEELGCDRDLDLGPARASGFGTYHQADSVPHGIVLESGGARIAFSGDTGWFDELPDHVRGADLFICECTLFDEEFEYHLNYRTLRDKLDQFECKRIILTHLGRTMAERRGRLEVETADDGLVLTL